MILNRLFTILVFTTLAMACKDQPKTCQDFHHGKFQMDKPEDGYSVQIERIRNLQVETNPNTGAVTKATVNWVNICNYELTYITSTSPNAVNLIGKVLQVSITGIQGSTYTYDAVLRGTQTVTQGKITMID